MPFYLIGFPTEPPNILLILFAVLVWKNCFTNFVNFFKNISNLKPFSYLNKTFFCWRPFFKKYYVRFLYHFVNIAINTSSPLSLDSLTKLILNFFILLVFIEEKKFLFKGSESHIWVKLREDKRSCGPIGTFFPKIIDEYFKSKKTKLFTIFFSHFRCWNWTDGAIWLWKASVEAQLEAVTTKLCKRGAAKATWRWNWNFFYQSRMN